jgi:LAS superfamily LD-carboxypeptidase LdcB
MVLSSLPLLLSLVLPSPVPGAALRASGQSWVVATGLAARVQAERGLQASPTVGYRDGVPMVMAVVDMDPDGKVKAEVATALSFFRMADAARRDGVRLVVVSGFRTSEQQAELYRLWRRRRGHLAARPGYSNHQSGHALDLDTSLPGVKAWLSRHARRFGFKRTVPTERWHWEHW